MEILFAGVLTWLVACVGAAIFFSRESRVLLSGEGKDAYHIAVRYLRWANRASVTGQARRITRFLVGPIFLSFYLPGREAAHAQLDLQMKEVIEEAQKAMRLRYQGGKPWLHPEDLYQFRLRYMAWFHESQADALKKYQRRMRYGMYGKAVHEAKQHMPCQCPQPIRRGVGQTHDVCTCTGLLPKDPPSLIL